MTIYLVILGFLLLCTFKKRNSILYIISFVVLFIVGGFRGLDVGTDTKNYLGLYETFSTINLKSFFLLEPGWVSLNLLCSKIFNDYRSVILCSQAIILVPLFTRLWKSTKYPSMGVLFYVLLYYYFNSFNITRQLIAIVIVFYGLYFIVNNQNKYFFYCVLFACLFHLSSIFCLFFPLINKIKKLSTSTISGILMVTYICGLYIIPNILTFVPYLGKYMFYIENAGSASASLSRLFLNLFFIFIYIYLKNNKFILFFLWGIILYNLLAFSPAAARLAVFLMISQLYIVSDMSCKNRRISVQMRTLFLLYGFIQFFTLLNANISEVVPYSFL